MPLLIWFCLIMCVIYFVIFTSFLGLFFRVLKVRQIIFAEWLRELLYTFYLFDILYLFLSSPFVIKYFNHLYYANSVLSFNIKNTLIIV